MARRKKVEDESYWDELEEARNEDYLKEDDELHCIELDDPDKESIEDDDY